MPGLEIKNLTAGYGKTMVLRNLSINVEKGEIICVLGRNGVGKSTLLKSIMGVVPVSEGQITYQAEDLTNKPSHMIAQKGLAYAAQEAAIFPELTVEQNLIVGSKSIDKSILDDVYEIFPILSQRLRQKAGTLSGGEKKMLLMARSMIRNSNLLILDEITEGVQPSIIDRIQQALTLLKTKGTSVLLVEQNVDFALKVADKYALMNNGEIIEFDSVENAVKEKIESNLAI